MERETARRTIADAGAALTAAGRSAPDAPVPSCPGWTVATVVKHVGLVHAWAAGLLRDYPSERPPFPKAPPDLPRSAVPDWADEQRALLLDAVAQSDGDRELWSFGRARPARFWWRRQAVETALHAWDATGAAGAAWEVPSDVGAEGIEELADGILARVLADSPAWGGGRTIHLHRTDGDGEWLITVGDPPKVEHGHAKGDLAVRGTGGQLLLWAWNRPADVERFGDTGLAEAWAANVRA
jgi:uncharacterized protein (TIGR03083 family)